MLLPQAHILDSLFRGAAPPPSLAPGGKGGAAGSSSSGGGSRSGGGGGSDTCTDIGLAELADPWGFQDGSSTGTGRGGGSGAAAAAAAAVSPATGGERPSCPLTPQQLAAVVRLNATGLPSDDVLLAALQRPPQVGGSSSGSNSSSDGSSSTDGSGTSSGGAGAGPGGQAFIGLWPAHAMFNHSCAPNAGEAGRGGARRGGARQGGGGAGLGGVGLGWAKHAGASTHMTPPYSGTGRRRVRE